MPEKPAIGTVVAGHMFQIVDTVRRGIVLAGDSNDGCRSGDVNERLSYLDSAAIRAHEISRIIDAEEISRKSRADIKLREGAASQNKAVEGIVGHVEKVSIDRPGAVDASSASKVSGIVRLDDRCAKLAVVEAHKNAPHLPGIEIIPGNIAALINSISSRGIPHAGVIKSGHHHDRGWRQLCQ